MSAKGVILLKCFKNKDSGYVVFGLMCSLVTSNQTLSVRLSDANMQNALFHQPGQNTPSLAENAKLGVKLQDREIRFSADFSSYTVMRRSPGYGGSEETRSQSLPTLPGQTEAHPWAGSTHFQLKHRSRGLSQHETGEWKWRYDHWTIACWMNMLRSDGRSHLDIGVLLFSLLEWSLDFAEVTRPWLGWWFDSRTWTLSRKGKASHEKTWPSPNLSISSQASALLDQSVI